MSTYTHINGKTYWITGQLQGISDLQLGLAGGESDATLARFGLTRVPEPPPAEPPTEAEQLAAEYDRLKNEHTAGFAYFQAQFRATATALAMEGIALPEPLTFRALLDLLTALPGTDWTRLAFVLRGSYDEVLIACDMATAERILPLLLTDETL